MKAVFHGHARVWSIARRDGVPIVSLPALGFSFDDAQPVGWVDARFRADGVSLTLRAVAGNRADDGEGDVPGLARVSFRGRPSFLWRS